jgi:hypothetical protein
MIAVSIGVAQAASFDATVTWQDNSANEDGFKVYRKTGVGGTYTQIGQVGAGVATFTDTGLAENTTYCYQIGAFNAIDEKKSAERCGATGGSVSSAPGQPTIIYIYKP